MPETLKTTFDTMRLKCPFCGRGSNFKASTFIPLAKHDCKCGAVAEIKPIRQTVTAKFWAVEWLARKAEG